MKILRLLNNYFYKCEKLCFRRGENAIFDKSRFRLLKPVWCRKVFKNGANIDHVKPKLAPKMVKKRAQKTIVDFHT